jgi:iron complex outermembrane recepter protein
MKPQLPLRSRKRASFAAALCASLAVLAPRLTYAADGDTGLLDLSLQELLSVEVTSASKKTQRLSETAAAAFVITQDDIRHSGARSIPELLRMVPGLDVAQIDANKWAVSARGFNGRFANKLLVLMDGRALYTPSFGGVFWDVQDTLLEDIERIEVIRGPGGALWGANAVNGVINIITRSSKDTLGGEVTAEANDGRSRSSSVRFGDAPVDNLTYRLYTKYTEDGANVNYAGQPTADQSHLSRFGARGDWGFSAQDTLSLTAEAYKGASGDTLMRPLLDPPYSMRENSSEDVSGFFTVGHWQRRFGENRELQMQFYYDKTNRTSLVFDEARESTRLDAQYHFQLGAAQDIVSGVGFRHNTYGFGATAYVTGSPDNPSDTDYNAFLQDQISVIADRLSVTAGLDLEHNPLSDHRLNALPSVRLLWSVNPRNHLWAAVTKTIGTPTYEDTDITVHNAQSVAAPGSAGNPSPLPLVTNLVSNPNVKSEQLLAYELGVRTQVDPTLTLDATVFLHDYRNLLGETLGGIYCEPSQISALLNPACVSSARDIASQLQFDNALRGHSTGLELAADWAPAAWLRLRGAYTYLDLVIEPNQASANVYAEQTIRGAAAYLAGQSPRHQFNLRGHLTLSHAVDLDLTARHVSALPLPQIPGYWSADSNLTWHPIPRFEVSLIGSNLLQSSHAEFASELQDIVPTRIERAFGARVRWTF